MKEKLNTVHIKDNIKDKLKMEVIKLKEQGEFTNVQELVEKIILEYLEKNHK